MPVRTTAFDPAEYRRLQIMFAAQACMRSTERAEGYRALGMNGVADSVLRAAERVSEEAFRSARILAELQAQAAEVTA